VQPEAEKGVGAATIVSVGRPRGTRVIEQIRPVFSARALRAFSRRRAPASGMPVDGRAVVLFFL
jgi:hypothetical protein